MYSAGKCKKVTTEEITMALVVRSIQTITYYQSHVAIEILGAVISCKGSICVWSIRSLPMA